MFPKTGGHYFSYGAMLCSAITVSACLLLIPIIHLKLENFKASLEVQMQEFRANTDGSWQDMMALRGGLRPKRQIYQAASGNFKQSNGNGQDSNQRTVTGTHIERCDCAQATCPPGLPGPGGQSGLDGIDGPPGLDGDRGVACSNIVPELLEMPCLTCAQGLPGPMGPIGPRGQPGSPGQLGLPGLHGRPGVYGVMGLKGTDGETGAPGALGRKGGNGNDGLGGKGTPGVQGPQGHPGRSGIIGDPGKIGPSGGSRGTPGDPGIDGYDGSDAAPGRDGNPGQPGGPGYDAHYCQCSQSQRVIQLPVARPSYGPYPPHQRNGNQQHTALRPNSVPSWLSVYPAPRA